MQRLWGVSEGTTDTASKTEGTQGSPPAAGRWAMVCNGKPQEHPDSPASVAAKACRNLHFQFTPARTARNGASQSVPVTATSTADAAKTSAVKAVVTVATSSKTPPLGRR